MVEMNCTWFQYQTDRMIEMRELLQGELSDTTNAEMNTPSSKWNNWRKRKHRQN